MKSSDIVGAWGKMLSGTIPLLSIEITRECPLSCPGCYAYGESHLGGGATLRDLSDYRGDELVERVLRLVRTHRPLHVSLVGGEPLVRHRELSRILPAISQMGIWTMVVTSAVIPIPSEWTKLPNVTLAVSVDGLPEHHNVRRRPATYERVLKNIAGGRVNIHLTVTEPMMARNGYLDEYLAFWSAQPQVSHIWMSTYTPQVAEESPEKLTAASRQKLIASFDAWRRRYPRLLLGRHTAEAFAAPPANPAQCTFAKMSVNYSADLATRVEPCIFGGTPDCSQCGCAISVALHAVQNIPVVGPMRLRHLLAASTGIGSVVNRLRPGIGQVNRWGRPSRRGRAEPSLVQIGRAGS
jgi:sulfatase maturation enzyme AslB (radical SAM superfamily)